MRRILFLAFALAFHCHLAKAQITLTQFSTGYTAPVDIKHCGDDRLFIVEQNGRIQICDSDGVKNTIPFLTITDRVKYGGEQGLLGLAFAPDFLTSGYFYVNYTAQPNGRTRISRFHYDQGADSVDRTTEEILLSIYQPYTNHNGGHINFGPDGYLYIGMGDGGSGGDPGNRAQNTDSLLGKMLRIAVDPSNPTYSIPSDNVFANDTSLGRPEIYTLGMRNPWRWSFDRLTGDLWIGDVGQNVYEEIDFQPAGIPSGRNYGWRCYEANATYNTSGCAPSNAFTYPVYNYAHTGGACSITGGYVYRGAKFNDIYGKYFYTDYCVSSIQALTKNGSTFSNFNYGSLGASSVVSFGEDRWGEIYCAGGSVIYKLASINCEPVSAINGGTRDTLIDCGTGAVLLQVPYLPSSTYSWALNGSPLGGPDSAAVTALQPGMYAVTVSNNNCVSTDSIYVNFIASLNITVSNLDTLYCVYDSRVNLLPNFPGGVFSGPGISGTTFDPATAGEGLHTITYAYTGSNGCTSYFTRDVRVDLCVGIDRPDFNDLKLFPVPAQNRFTVSGNFVKGKEVNMDVLDGVGKCVMTSKFVTESGEVSFDCSLPSGLYFVQLRSENSKTTLKLIIQ